MPMMVDRGPWHRPDEELEFARPEPWPIETPPWPGRPTTRIIHESGPTARRAGWHAHRIVAFTLVLWAALAATLAAQQVDVLALDACFAKALQEWPASHADEMKLYVPH